MTSYFQLGSEFMYYYAPLIIGMVSIIPLLWHIRNHINEA